MGSGTLSAIHVQARKKKKYIIGTGLPILVQLADVSPNSCPVKMRPDARASGAHHPSWPPIQVFSMPRALLAASVNIGR